MSISKNGTLASCSHLEKTRMMYKQKTNPNNKQLYFEKKKNGELIILHKSISRILSLQLGKCYKKETNDTAFSSILENIFVPGTNVIPPRDIGVPINAEGKHAFILHPQNKSLAGSGCTH